MRRIDVRYTLISSQKMKNLRYIQRKKCETYAKFSAICVRFALKALNFCKIYAKFNAIFVRSTLKSMQNI